MNRNMFFAVIVTMMLMAAAFRPTQLDRTTSAALAMPVAKAMLRYHGAALAMKQANHALNGVVSPTIAGFVSTGAYLACAGSNTVATILVNPGQAAPGTVVIDMLALSAQAPGVGLVTANSVSVAGTVVPLPCPAADGSVVILTQVF